MRQLHLPHASHPSKVIFVGDKKTIKRQLPSFQRFMEDCGENSELKIVGVDPQRLDDIVRKLDMIAQEALSSGREIAFDLTGGNDLSMVAVGIVYDRYHDRGLQLHRYNIRSRKIYDCDLDGKVCEGDIPAITVAQNVLLHGGCVVTESQKGNGTVDWDFNEDFLNDINIFWELCRVDPARWNTQVNLLAIALNSFTASEDGLIMICEDIPALKARLTPDNYNQVCSLLQNLKKNNLLTGLTINDEFIAITFKNSQVKGALEKAGNVLELTTCTAAMAAVKDERPVFNDVRTGVFIDWDADVHNIENPGIDTENEIDVILMRGLVPIFISCKNGVVKDEELYKLNTVTSRFGGKYAKKVLIATTLGKKTPEERAYFLDRANAMGINVQADVHELTKEQLTSLLAKQCI